MMTGLDLLRVVASNALDEVRRQLKSEPGYRVAIVIAHPIDREKYTVVTDADVPLLLAVLRDCGRTGDAVLDGAADNLAAFHAAHEALDAAGVSAGGSLAMRINALFARLSPLHDGRVVDVHLMGHRTWSDVTLAPCPTITGAVSALRDGAWVGTFGPGALHSVEPASRVTKDAVAVWRNHAQRVQSEVIDARERLRALGVEIVAPLPLNPDEGDDILGERHAPRPLAECIDELDKARQLAVESAMKAREEVDRLSAWLRWIEGGDRPCEDADQLRQWAYDAVTLGRTADVE